MNISIRHALPFFDLNQALARLGAQMLAHGPAANRALALPTQSTASDAAANDALCMQRYQRGEPQAFRTLYERYREPLHRYVLRMSTSAAEADEVFQDVWLSVIQGKERFSAQMKFSAWLFAIAHRRIADRWRAQGRHAPDSLHRVDDSAQALADIADTQLPGPDRHAHNHALGGVLLDAVSALPIAQREAFLMQAEAGLSLDEIAQVTGVPRETVKSRLRYASERLRRALEAWR